MKVCAVVCEYNPFHSGHEYHLSRTRELIGEDAGIISVMSGSFVQRGDFAVADKYERARCAVLGGADLVIELPSCYAVSSAERFAQGAIKLISALNAVDFISFGCETDNLNTLCSIAHCLNDSSTVSRISQEMKTGISYANARCSVVSAETGISDAIFNGPNNILAIEYIRALQKINSEIIPLAVKRCGAAHDSAEDCQNASASAIRQMLYNNNPDYEKYVPEQTIDMLKRTVDMYGGIASIVNAERAIIARLRFMSENEFAEIPDGGEGLYHRFRKAVYDSTDLSEIMKKTKTKRYTMSRIRRMLISSYIGLTADMQTAEPKYALVLAFNRRGRELLGHINQVASVPVITKPAHSKKLDRQASDMFKFQTRADDMHSLAYPLFTRQTGMYGYRKTPAYLE